jgi:hypothetical protein
MDAPTVLVFTSASCPIANRYAPELGRLHDRFAAARWWLVYVDRGVPLAGLRQHAREHRYPFAALYDGAHTLSRRTGARVTPEAAVLVGGRVVYRGRIDDRFADFGKERVAATRHELADAVEAALAGRPVAVPAAEALGCAIE